MQKIQHKVYISPNKLHTFNATLKCSLFGPLKIHWRNILENWKKTDGINEISIPKDCFPMLLKRLVSKLSNNAEHNIKSGFNKCGIVPFNRDRVLYMLSSNDCNISESGFTTS